MNQIRVRPADLDLGGMHVDVDLARVEFEENEYDPVAVGLH